MPLARNCDEVLRRASPVAVMGGFAPQIPQDICQQAKAGWQFG